MGFLTTSSLGTSMINRNTDAQYLTRPYAPFTNNARNPTVSPYAPDQQTLPHETHQHQAQTKEQKQQ